MEPRIRAGAIASLALSSDGKRIIEIFYAALCGLSGVALLERCREVQQRVKSARAADQEVSEMRAERTHKVQGPEALGEQLVENEHCLAVIPGEEAVDQREGVIVVNYAKVADYILILDLIAAEGHRLVEYCECVTHGAVGLVRYHMQTLVIYRDAFLGSDAAQVPHHVRDAYAVEIIGLTAAEYRRDYLVLLGSREDEYRV